MHQLTNSITNFFKKDFKKRFLITVSFPFLLGTIYFLDYLALPEITVNDQVVAVNNIHLSTTEAISGMRKRRKVAKQFITEKNYSFATTKKRLPKGELVMKVSPLFGMVKSVHFGAKSINVQSSLNGLIGILIVTGYGVILLSALYVLIKRKITMNAKLNLIYLNILIWILTVYFFFKFVL